MTSFIVLSKNREEGSTYIHQQCDILHISPFDRILLNKDLTEKATGQSLGITDIKNLQKKIYLKPSQGTDKAIIIQDAPLLTSEAQNALLKVLEEPPQHTYIYLLTDSLRTILLTIRSRCTIIRFDEKKKMTNEVTKDITNFLIALPSMTIQSKLRTAEIQGKQKQSAVDWLENLLEQTRRMLKTAIEEGQKEHAKFYIHLAKKTQETYNTIQSTNVNVRLALEHLLLSV